MSSLEVIVYLIAGHHSNLNLYPKGIKVTDEEFVVKRIFTQRIPG